MEASEDKTLPIVLLNSFDFLTTAFYAPPNLVPRLTYVISSKTDLNGAFYAPLRTCCGSPLGPPILFSDFLAYGGTLDLPRLDDFHNQGAVVTVDRMANDHFLVRVTFGTTGLEPPLNDKAPRP
jgi:hypothetical protein